MKLLVIRCFMGLRLLTTSGNVWNIIHYANIKIMQLKLRKISQTLVTFLSLNTSRRGSTLYDQSHRGWKNLGEGNPCPILDTLTGNILPVDFTSIQGGFVVILNYPSDFHKIQIFKFLIMLKLCKYRTPGLEIVFSLLKSKHLQENTNRSVHFAGKMTGPFWNAWKKLINGFLTW